MNETLDRLRRRLNPYTRKSNLCCTQTMLELSCIEGIIQARNMYDESSKEFEYMVIDVFLKEAKKRLHKLPHLEKQNISYQTLLGVSRDLRQYDIRIVPVSLTRRYIKLRIDNQTWYVDPTIRNWVSRYYDIPNTDMYVSRKRPKWMVKKDVIAEGEI